MTQIFSMMSLTMMGLTPGSAGTCNFPFYLDESVGHVDEYVGHVSSVGFVVFVPTGIMSTGDIFVGCVCAKRSQVQKWSTLRNIVPSTILIILLRIKISFGTIVLF